MTIVNNKYCVCLGGGGGGPPFINCNWSATNYRLPVCWWTNLQTKIMAKTISMSIVPPLTTAKIKPTVSLGDKPIELESAVPGEGGGERENCPNCLRYLQNDIRHT